MPKHGPVIMVCTANICRSPMAAALLRHALKGEKSPLNSIEVISAGVAARDGEPVSTNSVTALRKVGIDISKERSRYLSQEMASEALAIFCMTETHRAIIEMEYDPSPKNLFLMREFLPSGMDKEIADPYGGPLHLYEQCRDEMVEAIPSLIEYLRKWVK
jgi:protein-tyrosine-phosphatase